MPRGRPVKSEIRQNIVDILQYMKKGYGYDIYRKYVKVFPRCTLEVIYYHLKKGVSLGEFTIQQVKQEQGNFSWGPMVEKTYYALGPNAKPRANERIREVLR
jgi:hypothetical protein